MASELKVNKISPESGTTLTLGDSGDTINFGSGVLPNFENLTVTGDLTVDTNSLKVDSTNNFVGIGTATPSVALDVVGAITATGNITGTLATAAQPNITSVGTLSSLSVSGNITGTLATAAQPNITSLGTLTGLTTTGNINLGDNDVINLGASNDLQIFHDGSNSYIKDEGAGELKITTNGTAIQFQKGVSEIIARFVPDGNNELYYDNSKKLETTSTGATVTGNLSVTGNILTSEGSATTPSLQLNDNDTGLFDAGANAIGFTTNGSEKVRIVQGGSVGIGTTNPAQKLHVEGSIYTSGNVGIKNTSPSHTLDISDTSTTAKTLRVGQSSGISTADATMIISNGGTGSAMLRFDYEGTNTDRARIGITSSGQNLQFFTAGNNERMRIDSSGVVMIGTTTSSPVSGNVTGVSIDQNGNIEASRTGGNPFAVNRTNDGTITEYRRGGTTVGSVSVTSSGTTYNTTSDYRLKDNIEIITDGTERLMKLKPVRHSWKESSVTVDGFLAHEVQEAGLEYAVTGEKDGKEMQSMDYGRITPILVSALQNAINEINILKQQIQKLEVK